MTRYTERLKRLESQHRRAAPLTFPEPALSPVVAALIESDEVDTQTLRRHLQNAVRSATA
ncbi:MAG: hypothetical protein HLUCCX14_05015 [Marinobacter excellens HL-55]|uniref:Uncharacterized protein n=1 Tax=Marinobacter excellens HL-55 TaxID=1305731 RepID=A0A0P7YIZ7_9GAMM|nr:MAG: hypothetical protein HLUCCX14_05015 [Marinobacter excellens HL-55]